MTKKAKQNEAENEGPLTKGDVREIVTEIVTDITTKLIVASEDRMMKRMDEKFEIAHQGMMSGFELVNEKIDAVSDRLDKHVGQNAVLLNKMDARIDVLETKMARFRHRTA